MTQYTARHCTLGLWYNISPMEALPFVPQTTAADANIWAALFWIAITGTALFIIWRSSRDGNSASAGVGGDEPLRTPEKSDFY